MRQVTRSGRVPGCVVRVKRSVDVARILEEHPELSEISFMASFSVSPYDPGRTSGRPEDCYPPEGGDVEALVDETTTAMVLALATWAGRISAHIGDRTAALTLDTTGVFRSPHGDFEGWDANCWEVD